MKEMDKNVERKPGLEGEKKAAASNVKRSRKYERFGETIRYMTWEEWQRFLGTIDNYKHKLMMLMIYELGCRVGEFVRIRLADIDFARGRIFFPKENTKTGRRRVSHLPPGLVNDLKGLLKNQGRMGQRDDRIRSPSKFLFSSSRRYAWPYTENRLRQIFLVYVSKAGFERVYGHDARGRRLHELTIHSLRHNVELMIMPSRKGKAVVLSPFGGIYAT